MLGIGLGELLVCSVIFGGLAGVIVLIVALTTKGPKDRHPK